MEKVTKIFTDKLLCDIELTASKRNVMTAWPPPRKTDKNVPIIEVITFKFCLTITQTESSTSSSIPKFVLTQLMSPCCAAVKSSLFTFFVRI